MPVVNVVVLGNMLGLLHSKLWYACGNQVKSIANLLIDETDCGFLDIPEGAIH